MTDSILPKVVHLFAQIVTFGKKIFDFEDKIFQALPTIILQFCSDARVRNGYRMAARTFLRHSMDIRNKGVAESIAELIEIDGDVALTLNSFVPASMRKTLYSTSVLQQIR